MLRLDRLPLHLQVAVQLLNLLLKIEDGVMGSRDRGVDSDYASERLLQLGQLLILNRRQVGKVLLDPLVDGDQLGPS